MKPFNGFIGSTGEEGPQSLILPIILFIICVIISYVCRQVAQEPWAAWFWKVYFVGFGILAVGSLLLAIFIFVDSIE